MSKLFEKKDTVAPEAKKPDPKSHGSGNSTGTFYKIEVRTSSNTPQILETDPPFIIDGAWREWPMGLGPKPFSINVPIRSWWRNALDHGVVPYEAAEAHRWGLLSAIDAMGGGGIYCIETRLVAVEFHETYSLTEKGVSEAQRMVGRGWDSFKDRDDAKAAEPAS